MDRCPCPMFYNGSVAGSVAGSVRIGRIGLANRKQPTCSLDPLNTPCYANTRRDAKYPYEALSRQRPIDVQ